MTVHAKLTPPGPNGSHLLGNLLQMRRDPFRLLLEYRRGFGDVVLFRLANRKVYLLNHPEHIAHVLVSHYQDFVKNRAFRMARGLLGDGLLLHEGETWRRQRRLMMPAFHRDRMAMYSRLMVAHSERMLAGWRDGEARDIYQEMMALTMTIVSEALFGADATGMSRELASEWCVAVNHHSRKLNSLLSFIPDYVPTPANLRYLQAVHRVDEIIRQIIDVRMAQSSDGDDLLSMLLQARHEDGTSMSRQELLNEVKTMLFAGHETTALALTWAIYLLAKNPAAEAAMLDEVGQVLDGRPPTSADVPSLRYTEWVVSETLRLFPPAWIFGREALVDFQLGGYSIGRGSTVVMSPWVMHRSPEYFAEPEEFRPERWASSLEKRLPAFVYFPFGAGPRICIGRGFARMESILVLATVLQQFKMQLINTEPVLPAATMTTRPLGGMKMVLHRRRKRE